MLTLSGEMYNWIKGLHIISVISWMAGLLYLPRLFVYHTQANPGSELYNTLLIMEKRLFFIIIIPAMCCSLFFGLILLMNLGADVWAFWWWRIKVISLILLLGAQTLMSHWRRLFTKETNAYSEKFYRIANEIPTILMIVIVIMAVVEPF